MTAETLQIFAASFLFGFVFKATLEINAKNIHQHKWCRKIIGGHWGFHRGIWNKIESGGWLSIDEFHFPIL
jgi:hypothetical protein